MPHARNWTEDADMTIRAMRAGGSTWAAIGAVLGLSRNTVIERGRRLCAAAPIKLASSQTSRTNRDDPNREALPAGHPVTWGLLSDQPYPGVDERSGDAGMIAAREPACLVSYNLNLAAV